MTPVKESKGHPWAKKAQLNTQIRKTFVPQSRNTFTFTYTDKPARRELAGKLDWAFLGRQKTETRLWITVTWYWLKVVIKRFQTSLHWAPLSLLTRLSTQELGASNGLSPGYCMLWLLGVAWPLDRVVQLNVKMLISTSTCQCWSESRKKLYHQLLPKVIFTSHLATRARNSGELSLLEIRTTSTDLFLLSCWRWNQLVKFWLNWN